MILILYFGHTGTAQKVAKILAEELKDAEVVDGRKNKKIDCSKYQSIILGMNVRMGRLNKSFMKWMKHHKAKLNIPAFAYVVGADASQKSNYLSMLEGVMPEESEMVFAGGILDSTAAKGLSKMVIDNCIAELKKRDLELPTLCMDQIYHLAESVEKKKAEQAQPSTIH